MKEKLILLKVRTCGVLPETPSPFARCFWGPSYESVPPVPLVWVVCTDVKGCADPMNHTFTIGSF